jgi:hypothetical protein
MANISFSLTSEEAALIARILSEHLSDLRAEIGATEDYDLRQAMKQEEKMLVSLLSRMGEGYTEP